MPQTSPSDAWPPKLPASFAASTSPSSRLTSTPGITWWWSTRRRWLTGNKADQKTYFRHSGLHGRRAAHPLPRMIETHPERVIELAVKGMLPKNALGRKIRKKLRVYPGTEHPHAGQQPQPLEF
jgi:hypothetical protein